jgi:hypothetical protein
VRRAGYGTLIGARCGVATIPGVTVVGRKRKTVHVDGRALIITVAMQGALAELEHLLAPAGLAGQTPTSMEQKTAQVLGRYGLIGFEVREGVVWARFTPDGVVALEALRAHVPRGVAQAAALVEGGQDQAEGDEPGA